MKRYSTFHLLRHEFITIRAVVKGLGGREDFEFWLRIDRSGVFENRASLDQSSSILKAEDKVCFDSLIWAHIDIDRPWNMFNSRRFELRGMKGHLRRSPRFHS